MTKWVKDDVAPPASRIPRIADGTLVPVTQVNFPDIAGVQTPKIIPAGKQAGKSLPLLVPQVGEDGNELAGVRTAESVVAMATYTGWNFRNASIGGMNNLVNLLGSAIPLARTKGEREAAHDPRKSVEERYPSRDAYLASRASGRREPGEGSAAPRRRPAAGHEADGRAVGADAIGEATKGVTATPGRVALSVELFIAFM